MKALKTQLALALIFGSMPAAVAAQERDPGSSEAKKPRKIAHGGCYYPFPVQANDPTEPIAEKFSLDRGAEYLDGLTQQWTREVGCVTCHTTLSYFSSLPARKN